ncbi:MAG: hypothetical protein ABS52_19440 [Gemmatimonadetes bacterium SCN 70-22]|nr:MAG: hypothetical protein ABS52_19440 [Gemmatimonadetes bacterium SCN 70-22]
MNAMAARAPARSRHPPLAAGRRFLAYTAVTVLLVLAFGAWSGSAAPRIEAGLDTPWTGAAERIFWYAYQLWFLVLAIVLLREKQS